MDTADRDLIAAMELFRKENFLSYAEVASNCGMSATTLSQILAGTYQGDTQKYINAMRNWLKPLIDPTTLDIVQTETFSALVNYYDDARATHSIYCIMGKSGFGKTVSARYFSRTRLRAHWVSGRVNMGAKNLLDEITRTAKIKATLRSTVYDLQNAIIEHMKTRSTLIIVDEADKLNIKALDALREIYDAVNIGLVLIGEPSLEYKLKTPDRTTGISLARLYSRIDEFVDVSDISSADVHLFLKMHGIGEIKKDAFNYILQSVNKIGGYRRLVKMIHRLRANIALSGGVLTQDVVIDTLAKFPA